MIAVGGKSIYGVDLGILMLDAQFPRIPGDMGNAQTWPFPVRYKIVRGASPDLVVRGGAAGLLDAFIDAGRELVAEGATGITTNCGFLALYQAELAAALNVPVATSSMMQHRMIAALLPPGKKVGILTISAETMTDAHLKGAGVPLDTPIFGVAPDCAFQTAILGNALELDVEAARADLVNAANRFVKTHPDLGAILLECTNMPPYAADIARATDLPVYSIYDMINWFAGGLCPRTFPSGPG